MIFNLGTQFLILIFLLVLPCIIICSKPCIIVLGAKFSQRRDSLSKSLQYNIYIRYFLESFMDIAICASLNLSFLQKGDGLSVMKWDTPFQTVNNLAFFTLTAMLLLLPFWTLGFYCKNHKKWQDPEFLQRYDAVFTGLKTDKRSSLAYTVIFLLKRIAFVLVVSLAGD